MDKKYIKAYEDKEFMGRDDLLGVKMQLEMMKPRIVLEEQNIKSTISVFGSARIIPKKKFNKLSKKENLNSSEKGLLKLENWCQTYSDAYQFAYRFSNICNKIGIDPGELVLASGGGPGIMEAINKGAHDGNRKSLGFNIKLPFEAEPNKYITPELSLTFNYFSSRKMNFLLNTKGVVAFPGGCGTQDEFWNTLTLMDTGKIPIVPIILYDTYYWESAINLEFLINEGLMSQETYSYIYHVDNIKDIIKILFEFYESN